MDRAERAEVLQNAVAESRLSGAKFARYVLYRDPKTIYRWLSLERPIPEVVFQGLIERRPAPWP